MAALKFISEIVSGKSIVGITNVRQIISARVTLFLQDRKDVELVEIVDANTSTLPDKEINLIVHFAGFDKPSLAQTLYHTSALHRLMDYCLKYRAKFILVLPEKSTPQQQTAITLAQQFGGDFGLKYTIITIPEKLDTDQAAEEIIHTFIHGYKRVKQQLIETPVVQVSQAKKSVNRFTSKHLLLVILALLSPWIIFAGGFGILLYALNCGQKKLDTGQWQVVQTCGSLAVGSSNFLRRESLWVIGSAQLVHKTGLPLNDFFIATARIGQNHVALGKMGESLSSGHLSEMVTLAPGMLEQLTYSQAELGKLSRVKSLQTGVSVARELVTKFSLVSPGLQKIQTAPSQHWLILLQDSDELRPTGGFISNFAIATLENGQVTDVQVYDTESTDGLLHGRVVPPEDFAKATHQSNWYLRDSNWDPNFPTSAAKAAWFVDKELNQHVDGVVGVNVGLERKLAKILDLNPDTDAKSLTTDLLTKFKTLNGKQLQLTEAFLLQQLENRQLTLVSLDGSVAFGKAGWDGGIACCTPDTFYVVDSNVGVNKVNTQIQSDYKLNIAREGANINFRFDLTYANNSQSSAWPLGDYANYVRLLVPNSLTLDQVNIDQQQISAADINQSAESGFAVWGVMVNVPVSSVKTVTVLAHRASEVPTGSLYWLKWLNQPGAAPVSLMIASGPNIGYNAVLSSPAEINLKLN